MRPIENVGKIVNECGKEPLVSSLRGTCGDRVRFGDVEGERSLADPVPVADVQEHDTAGSRLPNLKVFPRAFSNHFSNLLLA